MRTRRARLWFYGAGLLLDLLLLAAAVARHSTVAVVVWAVFATGMALALVGVVRNRPPPDLTMKRIRIIRRQAVAGVVVSVALGATFVLLSPPSARTGAVILAAAAALLAGLGILMVVVLSRVLAQDEIPPRLAEAFREARRRSV